ncbi:DUF202 domain-containing protein [Mycolicibacterium moriokaense]|nr:DUF202 domain-containing protein [Mycolicibacterium moriokaense]
MADGLRSQPRPVIDRGLQAERTRLAWSRTALSFGAAGALPPICSASAATTPPSARSLVTNRRSPSARYPLSPGSPP